MTLRDLETKHVLLVGFEATNRAFYRAVKRLDVNTTIAIADQNTDIDVPEGLATTHLGSSYLEHVSDYDIIVRSPSVRYWPELKAVQDRVTTATQLFFEHVHATSKARFVGVTGTKGKSTTATLIHEVLKAANIPSFLVGNINNQDWDIIDQVSDDSVIVYELSSYMLQDFTERPDIAIWTNVYPDHLNWHQTIEEYAAAKANITQYQTTDDLLIYNTYDRRVRSFAEATSARTIRINDEGAYHIAGEDLVIDDETIMSGQQVALQGSHNWENALMVFAVANELGIDANIVREVLETFTGLPHRLELIATIDNVAYIDDTLATNPDATIAAIESFDDVSCVILGGEDRGYNYDNLASHLVRRSVPHVMLLPGCREKIQQSLGSSSYMGQVHPVETVGEAAELASKHAGPDTTVLLSPAAPSYDQFQNYEEKAEAFKQALTSH